MAYTIWVLIIIFMFNILYYVKNIYNSLILLYYIHKVPGPSRKNIFFGNITPLMVSLEDAFQTLRQWARRYYSGYRLWIGHITTFNIVNPEDAAIILSDIRHSNKSMVYNILHGWLQDGLLISNGDKWIQRRKILTPSFHFSILLDFLHVFNEKTADLVEQLKTEVEKPHTDVNEIIAPFTLRIIGETAMGQKMELNSLKERAYKNALHCLGEICMNRIFHTYLLYNCLYIFTRNFYRELKFVKTLHEFTKEVISNQEKRFLAPPNNKKKRLAMLDLLFSCKKEEIIDDAGIREEVDTVMFEGHDTISIAFCFGLMLIACHPQIQDKLLEEIQAVLGDVTKKPTYQELQKLQFMDRCIKEILRLYPSAPSISRKLGADIVTSSGYKLKKNTIALLHIYDIHHNPDIFPNPEKFDPDRFLPENCKNRHPYAYIPFSAGPRNCIGQKFAMLELKSVFCGILGNFVLKPVDTPETIVLTSDIVLRTRENIKVKFVPRKW